jgi:hypothetical protein
MIERQRAPTDDSGEREPTAMLRYADGILQTSWNWVSRLDKQEWLLLLIAVTALGFLCMRGFGSRKNY